MKKWQQPYATAIVVGILGAVYCANGQDSVSTLATTTDYGLGRAGLRFSF